VIQNKENFDKVRFIKTVRMLKLHYIELGIAPIRIASWVNGGHLKSLRAKSQRIVLNMKSAINGRHWTCWLVARLNRIQKSLSVQVKVPNVRNI